MTDLKQFTSDAIRTESKIPHVEANSLVLEELLNAYVGIGSMLDQVKKNIFYGKPFNTKNYAHNLAAVSRSVVELANCDPDKNKQTINVNPRLFHGIVGIATESVEMVEALNLSIMDMETDWVNVGEEIFDCNWYEQILIDELGLDWENIMKAGLSKLKKRYPEKFDSNSAIERDVAAERQILEDELSKPDC